VDVQPGGPDVSKVTVSGEGLKPEGVPASLPVTFSVDTRAAGPAGAAPLEATIKVCLTLIDDMLLNKIH
jgi:hypothetical protein